MSGFFSVWFGGWVVGEGGLLFWGEGRRKGREGLGGVIGIDMGTD